MTVAWRIDFEGGNVGDAVTTSTDSDITAVTGTPTLTSDSRTGTRAMLCSDLASTLIRTDWAANPVTHTLSMEVKPKTLTANTYFLRWGDTSNSIIASLRFGTATGKIDLTDAGNTVRASSSLSWAASTWYRFECDYDATMPLAPIITVRIYTVFGTAPVETISFTFTTAFIFGRIQYGGIGVQASGTRILVVDSIQVAYGIQRIGPLVEVSTQTNPIVKVASPLRTWSPLTPWPRTTAGLTIALPSQVAKVDGVRTWSPFPASVRTAAAGVVLTTPRQAVAAVERARPADGWGVIESPEHVIASTFATSSATTVSGLSTTIDITGATVGQWVYLFVVLDAAQTSISVTNAANPVGWIQLIEGDEAATTHYALYRRMKRTGDTTFTVSWPSTAKGTFGLVAYSGLDPSGPPDAGVAVALHTSGLTYPTATAVPAKDTCWAATFSWSRTSTSANKAIAFTPDSALTERVDVNNSSAAASPWAGQQIADSNGPVSVASHSYAATQAFAETHGGAILLYLVPAN